MGTPEHELSDLARHYGGTRESYREEAPQHSLRLQPYALAETPVTTALYATYIAAEGRPAPLVWHGPQPPDDRRDHPVVDVSWDEAQAFCAWLNRQPKLLLQIRDATTGTIVEHLTPGPLRLPSEAEWEHAARGSDGRRFAWGNDFEPAYANTSDGGPASTTPVGAYPSGAGPYGHLDLAGNVWEWTASLDGAYPYPTSGAREVPGSGRRILRGGCYANPHGFARSACRFRLGPAIKNTFIGLRLACSL
jgi:formylglycine-generating enzyme required for sulfatase activity